MNVKRKFIPFDENTITRELRAIPVEDRAKLYRAMKRYQESGWRDPRPAVIDDYGGGVLRIKNADREGQGRALFCVAPDDDRGAETLLVVLVVYKKETDAVPAAKLRTARARKAAYERKP